MYFTNASVLDHHGRINLSKFFEPGESVTVLYDDAETHFLVIRYRDPAEVSIAFRQLLAHATVNKVDGKGRIILPLWVRKLAHSETFLVTVASPPDPFEENPAVVLKPVHLALPAEDQSKAEPDPESNTAENQPRAENAPPVIDGPSSPIGAVVYGHGDDELPDDFVGEHHEKLPESSSEKSLED